MENRARRIPSVMKTAEFGKAVNTYKEVLTTCGVPTADIQKQVEKITDPKTVVRRHCYDLIDLANTIQTVPQRIISVKPTTA
jgi:hypothetical protein